MPTSIPSPNKNAKMVAVGVKKDGDTGATPIFVGRRERHTGTSILRRAPVSLEDGCPCVGSHSASSTNSWPPRWPKISRHSDAHSC